MHDEQRQRLIDDLYDPATNVPVGLSRLASARVLWVHPSLRAREATDQRRTLDDQLLSKTAFVVSEGPADVTGVADRYGGAGIGRNGGSGRSVLVNGYHVKGVGRTPLVDPSMDVSHANGGAYLAECVREILWAELLASSPFGASPIVALIDTGLTQRWDGDGQGKVERRCLLVRQVPVRAAHFERAALFRSEGMAESLLDARRVEANIGAALRRWGMDGWMQILHTWATRWAMQLGFLYAHRVLSGASTTSNIDLNGRFIDFGGFVSLACWAPYELNVGDHLFGDELAGVSDALRSLMLMHVDAGLDRATIARFFEDTFVAAQNHYRQVRFLEMMWNFGFDRSVMLGLLGGASGGRLVACLEAFVSRFPRARRQVWLPVDEGTVTQNLWQDSDPSAAALRGLLLELLGGAACLEARGLAATRLLRRPLLENGTLNEALYRELDVGAMDASRGEFQQAVDEKLRVLQQQWGR